MAKYILTFYDRHGESLNTQVHEFKTKREALIGCFTAYEELRKRSRLTGTAYVTSRLAETSQRTPTSASRSRNSKDKAQPTSYLGVPLEYTQNGGVLVHLNGKRLHFGWLEEAKDYIERYQYSSERYI